MGEVWSGDGSCTEAVVTYCCLCYVLLFVLCAVVCKAPGASGATIRNFGCFVLDGRACRE